MRTLLHVSIQTREFISVIHCARLYQIICVSTTIEADHHTGVLAEKSMLDYVGGLVNKIPPRRPVFSCVMSIIVLAYHSHTLHDYYFLADFKNTVAKDIADAD